MDTRGGTGYGVLDSGEDYGCSKACARTYPDCRGDIFSKQSCVFYFIPMNQLEMFIFAVWNRNSRTTTDSLGIVPTIQLINA